MTTLTPTLMLNAYASGVFPMAETAESEELHWFSPPLRAILPLETFHCPQSLAKIVRQKKFDIRFDSDFAATITGCATARDSTWINTTIREVFCELHRMGNAHSVEAWQDGKLVGGLYGASLGAAFFGESMFSLVSNASRVCLVHLVEKLKQDGFELLDVQYRNDHLSQFGIIEISRVEYEERLAKAVRGRTMWRSLLPSTPPQAGY